MQMLCRPHDDVTKWSETLSVSAGPLCGGFAGHRWTPLTEASEAELLRFSLTCTWISGWVNNCEVGDLRHHRSHYDIVMPPAISTTYKLHHIHALASLSYLRRCPIFSARRASCFVISWGLEAARFVSCGCSEIWQAPRWCLPPYCCIEHCEIFHSITTVNADLSLMSGIRCNLNENSINR